MKNRKKITGVVAMMFVAGVACADIYVPIGDAGSGGVAYQYSIGQTEVSVQQFALSGLTSGNAGNSTAGVLAPVVNVSWHDAARYANWLTSGDLNTGAYSIGAGNKVNAPLIAHSGAAMDALVATHGTVYVLPTLDEWFKAAYYTGSGFSLYANGTSTAPVAETDAVYTRTAGAGAWAVGNGTLEQNNTLNMSGNVWEWMETTANGSAYDPGNDAQLMAFRGGDYFLGVNFLKSTTTNAADDRAAVFNIGMRIVAIPEPGTISLMSLSTISLFFTRTIRRRKLMGRTLIPIRRERLCDSFLSKDEWQNSMFEVEESEYISEIKQSLKAWMVEACQQVHSSYKTMDRAFWSRMVLAHERKVARRTAIRATLKKKAINSLDAFLAIIMR